MNTFRIDIVEDANTITTHILTFTINSIKLDTRLGV